MTTNSSATQPSGLPRRIFVVGVPRSGTTLVQSLLAAHSSVTSWTESHFFARHFRRIPGLRGRVLMVRDPRPAVREFLQANGLPHRPQDAPWLSQFDEKLENLRTPAAFRSAAASRAFLTLLDEIAAAAGHSAWVEKTPAHLHFLPFLERIQTDSNFRFIHVIRDGLATISSLYRASRHWERSYELGECIARWNAEVEFSLSRVRCSPDRFVFYEDLLREPDATSRRLLRQLDLPWQCDLLDRRIEASTRITAPNEQPWKAAFDRDIAPSRHKEELSEAHRREVQQAIDPGLYAKLKRAAEGLDPPGADTAGGE